VSVHKRLPNSEATGYVYPHDNAENRPGEPFMKTCQLAGRWAPGCLALLMSLGGVASDEPLYRFDFAGDGSVEARRHLEAQGFQLKHDMNDEDKISLLHEDGALHLHTHDNAFGIMLHEAEVHDARRLRLHWGIGDYPDGASYEHGVDNEALMVYVFFGHEKFSSGSLLLPKSPYFIGFYLCAAGSDELEAPYRGNYYEKAGRFICVDHPSQGSEAVTELDLHDEFRKSFGLDRAPSVSAISVEVDTTHSGNDGHAAAFLRTLEFLP
jgi:hypothetical protein